MWTDLFKILGDASPLIGPLAALILVGAVREWWVWGHHYRREVEEKEYWRDKALSLAGLAEQTVEVAHDLAEEPA